jgi:hypothetical protein
LLLSGIPGVSVRELKPGTSVVVLLRHDAIQSDRSSLQTLHGHLPNGPATILTAKRRLDNIETYKSIAAAVTNGRNY